MHYFQFEIKEWVSNTAHLSLEEEAIYLRLVNYYYDSEQGIPENDLEMVYRKLRISNKELARTILLEFFKQDLEQNLWVHDRCNKEIAKYHAKSEQASKAGKASAEKRFNSRSTAVQPIINQESLIINQESIVKATVAKAPKAQRLKLESLPVDWANFCNRERPDLNPKDIWNQFRDYWISVGGSKGARLDWFATWRNWVRNQKSVINYTIDKPTQRWDATLEGVMAKGRELGILPKPGETEGQYRDRVRQG
jgi:uncharacterized protein YdaU (DUF1376 family)